MQLTRRYFLKSAGLSLFGVGAVPAFLRRTAFAAISPQGGGSKKILVAIFMRGAVDGLNVVVPYGENDYYKMRPSIAIPAPGKSTDVAESAIDLDGFFGFHPRLDALKPIFDEGQLAVIDAAGSPSNSRSHFEAQDFMETATPDAPNTRDGWLNRYLRYTPLPDPTPFRAVAASPRMPLTLEGPAHALAIGDLNDFKLRLNPRQPDTAGMEAAFQALYASASNPLLSSTAKETFTAVNSLDKISQQNYQPESGAQYPGGPFGRHMKEVAQLIKSDLGLEVAFVDVGGWDNHINEGGIQGQMANRLKEFGDSLAAFHRDMGNRMADIVVLTMSEFGRTARENGNRGTDHGHANVMFVMGGQVKGGKVYGKWPGLKSHELNQDRDLALTADFRDVFAEVVTLHLGTPSPAGIFPGFNVSPGRFCGFLG
ncbi:MAG: DUF1501 domain-containing protein [Acidobacteriota bacterium]|nr:DUF1501 domain-containing protein [Acidobacteriota bacterium]